MKKKRPQQSKHSEGPEGAAKPIARAPLSKLSVLPLVFFGVLLLARAMVPASFVFDEIHYIPAAKGLLTFSDNLNWVHPPLAKLIMGVFWVVFTKVLAILPEPGVFRVAAIVFGLLSLWSVRAWMLALGFAESPAVIAVWLTGFNFLWFVQSKTAMLDIFYLAMALWGLLYVYKPGTKKSRLFYWGWALLGFSMAAKWAAAPFIALAFVIAARPLKERVFGLLVCGVAYIICFFPLAFLHTGAVPVTELWSYHLRMLSGFDSIASVDHPYVSHWWEWPTLARPMWYTFESSPEGEHCIWAGGNPVLYWAALPLIGVMLYWAIARRDRAARMLSVLYWVPLLFWAVVPRSLQMYYYYLPSSLWVGPIVVWAHQRFYAELRATQGWLLIGFTLLCAVAFIYFLPIMDARALPQWRFLQYMWLRSWI